MNKKENQRVRLTKLMLKKALIDLLESTPLQQISITEICNRAEINRTTFYKYYSSECDLYGDIENDFIAILETNLSNSPEKNLGGLLNLIYSNQKMMSVIINNSSEENLSQRIFSLPFVMNNINLKRLNKVLYKEELVFFLFSGCYALIKKWINTGFLIPPNEMSVLVNNIISKFIS